MNYIYIVYFHSYVWTLCTINFKVISVIVWIKTDTTFLKLKLHHCCSYNEKQVTRTEINPTHRLSVCKLLINFDLGL